MDYYHGTTIEGLAQLKPFDTGTSNIKKPVVYLTTSRQLALHYIWDYRRCPFKMPMLDIRKDGVLIFQEMFGNALEYLYKGLSGYVYHSVGEYEHENDSGVHTCAISKEPVPVTDFEFIEDVHSEILSYEGQGKFIYERYENLPQWRHDVIRGHVIRATKNGGWFDDKDSEKYRFYLAQWPQYIKEAEVLNQHGLL